VASQYLADTIVSVGLILALVGATYLAYGLFGQASGGVVRRLLPVMAVGVLVTAIEVRVFLLNPLSYLLVNVDAK
jgi:hypothetical protein